MDDDALLAQHADRIAFELRGDRALAARVREEVLEHLRDAAVPREGETPQQARQRAIRTFGDAQVVAGQFRSTLVARRSRRLAAVAVLAIALALLAMGARLAWYRAVQWTVSAQLAGVLAPIASFDAWALRTSVLAGLAAWLLVAWRRGRRDTAACRRALAILVTTAAASLGLSVAADVTLTVLRVSDGAVSWGWLAPVSTIVLELLCVAAVLRELRAHRATTSR